jgi:hypothetical protein
MDLRYFTVKDQFPYVSVNAVFFVCTCRLAAGKLRDLWLSPRYKCDLRFPGMLRGVGLPTFRDNLLPHSALLIPIGFTETSVTEYK